MPALGQGAGKSAAGEKAAKRKPKPKTYSLPSAAPRGDSPSTRKQDFAKANAYKKTKPYISAVKAAYKAQPIPTRQKRVNAITGKAKPHNELGRGGQVARQRQRLTPEQKAILSLHGRRMKRGALLMNSHAYTDYARGVVKRFKNSPSYSQALRDAEHARLGQEAKKVDFVHETNPAVLKAAGFHKDGLAENLMRAPIGALVSGAAVADAAYHDPIGVPVKTAKQALRALPAIPGGLYDLVTHPAKTIEAEAKQFGERGSQKFEDRVKKIRKEGGFDYAGDAAALLGGSSAATKLLRRGAEREALRPALRVSGGHTVTPKPTGAFSDAVGRALQNRRATKHEKALQEAEAGGKPVDPMVFQAAQANRAAGRTVETVVRRVNAKQRRLVAKQRGRAIYGLRADQHRRIAADTKHIARLNAKERKALYYADTFGIRTPEHAAHVLPKLETLIKDTRARDPKAAPKGSLKKSDMLPDITAMAKAPHEYFTAKLADTVEAMRPDSLRAAAEDPSLHPFVERRRRYAPLAAVLGLEKGVAHDLPAAEGALPALRYMPNETDAAFIDRVAQHAKDLGLAEPLYFKSERYAGVPMHGAFTAGGLRATKRGPAYKGENLAAGLQDTNPRVYLRGKAENIKRKHNWNLVADILESNAIHDLAPGQPGGTTVSALRESMAQKGVDMNSVALWNPGVYRQLAHDATAGGEHFDQPEHFDNANIAAAMAHSVVRIHDGHITDGTGLPISEAKLAESSGWHAIPDATLKELEAQMVPSGKAGRIWDIAKGKASRAMLLTGNIPWLGFQVVSNVAAATAATGGRILNPKNWLDAYDWWKHDLTPEQRDRVGSYIGLDATGADSHQVKLGATTNSDLVNAYRAIKAHPIFHTGIAHGHGPSLSELNPLELMARADRSQNNIFRVVSAYSLAKRDAVRRMGESMGATDKAQLKLTSLMAKPPAEQLRAMAENKQVLEDHANAVADWMGDYTTMTAAERKVINRATMFYPYLRYSLRLVFYTLPVKHPAVTAILGELGQMRAEELKKLLGGDGSSLPWDLGKIYFGKGGHVTSIDLRRANPALNAIIDAATNKNPTQLVGVAPPWAGWIYDQLSQSSSFTGKDWRVHGKAAPYGGTHLGVSDPTRGRILADDILGITFPYREAEKLTQRGPQGDDSMLFSERRLHYKGKDSLSQLNRKFSERRTNFQQDNESLIHDLIPLLPQPDRGPVVEGRENRIIARATPKPGAKKKSKAKYFGGGSSGSGIMPSSRGSGLLP